MELSLALTALVMGLVGGPHCLAMCGAACLGLGGRGAPARALHAAPTRTPVPVPVPVGGRSGLGHAPWLFLLGRLGSYASLGAVAAGSMQTLGWLGVQSAALRPLWSLMHVAAAALGLVLLWNARQPAWLEEGGLRLWRGLQSAITQGGRRPGTARAAPLVLGLAWGFLPCGLLYSALLVAALSPGLWEGAGVMLLFALGSSPGLLAGPWLRARLGRIGSGAWAVRLAGAGLLALSAWALWRGLADNAAPWCVAPALV